MNDPEEMLKLLAKYKNTTRNDLILSLLLAKMNVIESMVSGVFSGQNEQAKRHLLAENDALSLEMTDTYLKILSNFHGFSAGGDASTSLN
jgi:hypothetical protein